MAKRTIQVSEATRGWIEARMRTVGVTKEDFVRTYKWPRHYYDRLFTQRSFWTTADLAAFCDLLKVRPEVLLHRLGDPVQPLTVPVIGSVRAGVVSLKSLGRVPAPSSLPDVMNTAALRVGSDGTFADSVLYFEPPTELRPTAIDRLAYIETTTGVAPLVGALGKVSRAGVADISLLDGEKLQNQRVIAASPVLWIHLGKA